MKIIITTLFGLLLTLSAHAFNSQVTHEGITEMVRCGVSQKVIDYLIAHQTCSIGAQDVIKMKKAGLSDTGIITAIDSDRYRKPEESTVIKEIEIIEKLKQAGLSDEAVLQYLDRIRSNRDVDLQGVSRKHYGNTPRRPPYPVEGSRLPEKEDNRRPDILIYGND